MAQLTFDDVQLNQTLGWLDKGTISTAHVMRWSAAVENWHRIHYDQDFAVNHDKLPGVLINGSWKQHILVQLVKDALGEGGWLWKLSFRYQKMDVAGEAVRGKAVVVDKQEVAGLGFVTLAIHLENEHGEVSTAGYAIGVLPCKNGPQVPYPFVEQAEFSSIRFPTNA